MVVAVVLDDEALLAIKEVDSGDESRPIEDLHVALRDGEASLHEKDAELGLAGRLSALIGEVHREPALFGSAAAQEPQMHPLEIPSSGEWAASADQMVGDGRQLTHPEEFGELRPGPQGRRAPDAADVEDVVRCDAQHAPGGVGTSDAIVTRWYADERLLPCEMAERAGQGESEEDGRRGPAKEGMRRQRALQDGESLQICGVRVDADAGMGRGPPQRSHRASRQPVCRALGDGECGARTDGAGETRHPPIIATSA